jgi:hypothetical protein
MAARYRHLSPVFLSDAVMLLDGAFAEPEENPESTSDGEDQPNVTNRKEP